jgi:16S rRNA (uracil1498-N3)-methyltransferase
VGGGASGAAATVTDAQSAPRFVIGERFEPGGVITLGEDAARHMRVLRLGAGGQVYLLDGAGNRARATLVALAKRNATVEVDDVDSAAPLPEVHLLAPIADRDRMLQLAEKASEFAATSWRPVLWRRSRSVSPRGEGSGFQRRVHARMVAALEQSGGRWLPTIFPDASLDRAVEALHAPERMLLVPDGEPIAPLLATLRTPLAFALGPEGGFDASEREELIAAGFRPVSLGPTVLRFETAGIAALALARAAFAAQSTPS